MPDPQPFMTVPQLATLMCVEIKDGSYHREDAASCPNRKAHLEDARRQVSDYGQGGRIRAAGIATLMCREVYEPGRYSKTDATKCPNRLVHIQSAEKWVRTYGSAAAPSEAKPRASRKAKAEPNNDTGDDAPSQPADA